MSKRKKTRKVRKAEKVYNGEKIVAYKGSISCEEDTETQKTELIEVSISEETMAALIGYQINKLEKTVRTNKKELALSNANSKKARKEAARKEKFYKFFKKTRPIQPAFFGAISFIIGSLLTLYAVFKIFGTITTASGTAWSFFAYLVVGVLLGAGVYKFTKFINSHFMAPKLEKSSEEQSAKVEALEEKTECVSAKLNRAQEELDIKRAELLLLRKKKGYSIPSVGV